MQKFTVWTGSFPTNGILRLYTELGTLKHCFNLWRGQSHFMYLTFLDVNGMTFFKCAQTIWISLRKKSVKSYLVVWVGGLDSGDPLMKGGIVMKRVSHTPTRIPNHQFSLSPIIMVQRKMAGHLKGNYYLIYTHFSLNHERYKVGP